MKEVETSGEKELFKRDFKGEKVLGVMEGSERVDKTVENLQNQTPEMTTKLFFTTVCPTLKMCAFRMWWPSSMVCWRFSLPSCRENMNARRACPFLEQETQSLGAKDSIPQTIGSQLWISPHHSGLFSWCFSTAKQNGWEVASLQKMANAVYSSSHFRAFSRFPYLCEVTKKEALGQGRSLSLEPLTHCPSSIIFTLFIYLCLSQKCQFHETKGLAYGTSIVIIPRKCLALSNHSNMYFFYGWMNRGTGTITGPGIQVSSLA